MSQTIISTISKIYAKALLELTSDKKSVEEIRKQLDEISEVLVSSADLKIVMANSSISVLKKIEILDAIFDGKIEKRLLNFLKILVEKNRFDEFESIKNAYVEQIDSLSNLKKVEITSSVPLNFENKSNVLFKLEHKLECEVLPEWKVDDSLIAGLKFKFDDTVIDTSVKSKLESLRKSIVK
jgi:F-type H+-transporting ATPase subunit delta